MKTVIRKTVAMMFAMFALTSLMACSSDDYDQPKEYTYTFDTSHMTITEGAPFTLNEVAQEYKHYFDMGCYTEYYNNIVLQDIILTTDKIEVKKGWKYFLHGYALVICHHYSYPNKTEPMFKLDYDTNTLTELDLK